MTTKESRHNMLEFSFTLLADQPLYQSQTENTETGGIGVLGGNTLGNTLPNSLTAWDYGIIIDHEGDKKAPFYIKVSGSVENPRITNITNGQSLKILANTTLLEIDNRQKPFKVTDNGANIKSARRGEFVYLSPGVNQIVVSIESWDTEASVTIRYRATFE